jgi:hypothetical protein
LTAVRGFGPNDVWMTASYSTGDNGVLYFDGGSITLRMSSFGSDTFSDLELTRTPARIAVAQYDKVWLCDRTDGGCLMSSGWSAQPLAVANDTVTGLCTDGSRFFAAGADPNAAGVVFRLSGGTVQRLASHPAATAFNDCEVLSDGTVLAAGTGQLAVHQSDGGDELLTVDAPGLAFPSSTRWLAIAAVGGRVFLAGDAKTIVEWIPDGGFALRLQPTASGLGSFRAIGGLHLQELYAVGDFTPPVSAARFNGTSWGVIDAFSSNVAINAIAALTDNDWLAAGQELYPGGGIVGAQLLNGRR